MSNVICPYCGQPGVLRINGCIYPQRDNWQELLKEVANHFMQMTVIHSNDTGHEVAPQQWQDTLDQITKTGMKV